MLYSPESRCSHHLGWASPSKRPSSSGYATPCAHLLNGTAYPAAHQAFAAPRGRLAPSYREPCRLFGGRIIAGMSSWSRRLLMTGGSCFSTASLMVRLIEPTTAFATPEATHPKIPSLIPTLIFPRSSTCSSTKDGFRVSVNMLSMRLAFVPVTVASTSPCCFTTPVFALKV